ncbi:MAG: hypothetical protein ABR881_21225 [Candidatus Sulfotelmatobacter sp.]
MTRSGISFSVANTLIVGCVLWACPFAATAQVHAGGMGGGALSGNGKPSGVKEEDSLKDFHEVMAVQATSQQTTEFQTLVRITEAAKAELQLFLERWHNENGATESAGREAVDKALDHARSENQKFQQGFSAAQKSGLKEIAKRLAKADSDLEQEEKRLDQSLEVKAAGAEVAARAENLSKALTDFYNQQLALGREMSITLANGQDLAFTLPAVNHPVNIVDRTIVVPVSGALAQIAVQGGQRTFKLEMTANLSDLQQNITELLRAQLDTSETCGQRVAIRRATLTPSTPASLLVLQLHFERWTCSRMFGQQTSNELAEGDGTVEVKLTAAVEKPNTLKIVATFGRVDATGMMGEALRSGSLGEDLRDTIAQSVLSAAQTGSDFKVTLPAAVRNSAVIQSARFQDTGAGNLTLLLDGQLEISNEQADALASQLNQALSAQGTPLR